MKARRDSSILLLALVVGCSIPALANDVPPGLINYQGVLRNAAGAPLDGEFDMTFRFVEAPCNCCEIQAMGCSDETCEDLVCNIDSFCCNIRWDNICVNEALTFPACVECCAGKEILRDDHTGTGAVTVTGGLFNVALGGGVVSDGSSAGVFSSLDDVFREAGEVYMEVTVEGEALSPKTRVLSAAYAISARRADPACHGAPGNLDRFVDCGNGTVTDTATGLIWMRNASCVQSTWWGANIFARGLAEGQCDLKDGSAPGDWRLPTEAEWHAIIDQANANRCSPPFYPDTHGLGCCGTAPCEFTGLVSNDYWSSSTIAASPDFAWRANLVSGIVTFGGKSAMGVAWAVRSGP